MQDNAEQYRTLGSVGGAGSSAVAGGFAAGPHIAGKGGARGDSSSSHGAGSIKVGGDVRVGGHFGPTTSAANAASGYNQGDEFAAAGGMDKLEAAPGAGGGAKGGIKAGGNLLGGALDSQGNPKASQGANGYNQGDMFAGKAK